MGYKKTSKRLMASRIIETKIWVDGLAFYEFLQFGINFKTRISVQQERLRKERVSVFGWGQSRCAQSCESFCTTVCKVLLQGKNTDIVQYEGIKLKEFCNGIHIPIPEFLLFVEELLYLDSTGFTNGNATNPEISGQAEFFANMDWVSIFRDMPILPEKRKSFL